MPANFSALRQRPGSIRVATLLLGLLGLIFIIVALALHNTDDFVGYEASVYDFLSLATVRPRKHSLTLTVAAHTRQFCYTIAWSFSAICVLVFHGPYPPPVDIALDFVGWGLAWAMGALVIQWSAEMDYPSDCGWSYNSVSFCTRAKTLMAMEILAGILAFVYG